MTIHTSLAVKYRPHKWEDVVGHSAAVSRLRGIVKTGKVPQAIMFSGPSGTGKTTLGRMLALYLNCDKKTACGECNNCKLGDKHPDVKEINAAEARGIDDVRKIISEARYKPQFGKYRFVIVDEAQQLTPQAAQALLKPLEEPPANTIYLICTMEPDKILPAIRGRCNKFELNRIGKDDITSRLQVIAKKEKASFISEKAAGLIAEASGGQVRDAVTILESVIQFVEGQDVKVDKLSDEKLEKLLSKAMSSLLEVTDDMVAAKVLLSVYKGSVKSLHAAILDANDYKSLLSKLLYLNMSVLDELMLKEKHSKVWFMPATKKLMDILRTNGHKFDEDFCSVVLETQGVLLDIANEVGAFMSNDRHIFATRLLALAYRIKARKK